MLMVVVLVGVMMEGLVPEVVNVVVLVFLRTRVVMVVVLEVGVIMVRKVLILYVSSS